MGARCCRILHITHCGRRPWSEIPGVATHQVYTCKHIDCAFYNPVHLNRITYGEDGNIQVSIRSHTPPRTRKPRLAQSNLSDEIDSASEGIVRTTRLHLTLSKQGSGKLGTYSSWA